MKVVPFVMLALILGPLFSLSTDLGLYPVKTKTEQVADGENQSLNAGFNKSKDGSDIDSNKNLYGDLKDKGNAGYQEEGVDDCCEYTHGNLDYFDRDDFLTTEAYLVEQKLINRGADPDSDSLLFGSVEEDDFQDGFYLPPDMNFKEDNSTIFVHSNTLNLRSLPTADSEILHTFKNGDSFTRTGIGESWSEIVDSSGNKGYVFTEYTGAAKPTPIPTPIPKSTSPAKANTLGESIALEAQKYLGVRYVWAATDPSYGFDCSGLTYYVFNRYGISTPRGSVDFKNAGTIVPYSQMAPGDIISWDTRNAGRVTHVGIYIGNGMMVHASSSNKRVVKISVALYQSYARTRLLQIHRFYKN